MISIKEARDKLRSYFEIKKAIMKMPWVDFEIIDKDSKKAYEGIFDEKVKEGPYKKRKKNVALLCIPESFDVYRGGKEKQALRTNIKKAVDRKYICHRFRGMDHIEEIMEINTSKNSRGGKPMEESYVDEESVRGFLQEEPELFGIFTENKKLVGYIHVLRAGSMLATNKILGHAEYLDDGIMYYMISELVKDCLESPQISHIMYASYLSGRSHAGYTYFKRRCGFEGYNIRFIFR